MNVLFRLVIRTVRNRRNPKFRISRRNRNRTDLLFRSHPNKRPPPSRRHRLNPPQRRSLPSRQVKIPNRQKARRRMTINRPYLKAPAEPPIQTQSPEEGKPSETSEGSEPPTEEPQPEQSTPPTTEESAVPEFDIQVWIDYAAGYAESVELNLSPDATACWDNPITAGSQSIYLQRDIQSRLNRYKRDGMTDVWIWAEERLDGNYDLFIGYA